jgi:bacterioferritin-associated ferredoxin
LFACICRAVTSDEVTAAIDGGAATVRAVAKATGASTRCGTCRDRIKTMINEHSQARPRVSAPNSLQSVMVGGCVETNDLLSS